MRLFRKNTPTDITDSTAAFMPNGRTFGGKNRSDAILRKLLSGMSLELYRIDEQMELMAEDYDINVTTQFLPQWEAAVSIRDSCLDGTGTLEERRQAVLAKLAGMNLTTDQDFIDLAAIFGVTVTISQGADIGLFPMTFPFPLVGSAKEAKFTMIVGFDTELETFPYVFPFIFGDATRGLIECIFNKLKPANVQIIYQ
jgi:uncharacterized protein YmfQ (DUF2313 family)